VAAHARVESDQAGTSGRARQAYTLRVSKDATTIVSLDADGAKLSEVAADLAKRIGVPINVGPTWRDEAVSVNFSDLPLEQALSTLGPHVFIDYEIRSNVEPIPREIHLMGFEEPEAPSRGASHGIVLEGNTEETGTQQEQDPLQVLFENNRLSIMSKQQPLALVVRAVAEALGVPAEIKYAAADLVDIDLKLMDPEQAIQALSPNIRMHVRVDLYSSERSVRLLALVPSTQQ
jgi:hypothetical protein